MSPIGVLGSKVRVAKDLIALMPPEAFGKCYIELFAGGAGVFFEKQSAEINILNDLDPDLAVIYEAIHRDHEAVEAELRTLLDDDHQFEELKRLRESPEWQTLPEARRAAGVIYVYKASMNSNQTTLSSSSKTRSSFNPRQSLEQFAAKLERAQVRHFTWAKCLDVYLSHAPQIEAFVFADPPYVVADTKMHYRFNFHPVEHVRFWHRMNLVNKNNDGRRNVKIMITYDDSPVIRALYREADGWRIRPLPISYSSAHDSSRSRTELVITNYDPPSEAAIVKVSSVAVDWSDVPADRVRMGDIPFEQMKCCEKELAGLILRGIGKGKCRECGAKVSMPR